MDTIIKEWYIKEHPEDEDVKKFGIIKDGVTFGDVWKAIQERRDVYDVLGCESPAVRHSVFYELALKAGVSYDTVYSMYLEKNRSPIGNRNNKFYSYLIEVPVKGTIEISSNVSKDTDFAFKVYKTLKESDYGALRNIDTKTENVSEADAIHFLMDYLKKFSPCKTDDNHYVINFPVKGDVLLSIKAVSAEDAISKVLKTYENVKKQIMSDKSVCGDLKDIVLIKDGIKVFNNKHSFGNVKSNEYEMSQV